MTRQDELKRPMKKGYKCPHCERKKHTWEGWVFGKGRSVEAIAQVQEHE